MTLKEALQNKSEMILEDSEDSIAGFFEYQELLESIVLLQDEALKKVYKIDKGFASHGMSNGTYKIVVQTQSEVLEMLDSSSENTR